MIKHIYILLFTILLMASCETMINDVNAPEGISKLVVSGTLSPQFESTNIKIGLSTPYFGSVYPDYTRLDSALVTISGAGQEVTLHSMFWYNMSDGIYFYCNSSELKIVMGETYYINVLLKDGTRVNAKTTVPDQYPNAFEVVDIRMEEWSISFRIRIQDILNKRNYYRIADSPSYLNFRNEYFEDHFGGSNLDGRVLYSDLIDGYWNNQGEEIYLRVFSTDENYFRFHTTYQNEAPGMFTETSLVFSNIEGGLGYFGSVVYVEQRIDTILHIP